MDEQKVVDIHCGCGESHCAGNIYICPEKNDLYYVSVVDNQGYVESTIWLNTSQLEFLIEQISEILVDDDDE